ncbi:MULTISPECIES: hypothetical protein [Streptomyces]|uniref:hypothetical protein n=1 Tax=Streptomyces TaxID=1883 RepID=UPI00210A50FD|nr:MULTISPECIES: hypothetical protein [Streptomyces]UUA11608.1 hypothetical protein NNW98_39020 [Streptomyces koelreuteriae]UUA19187.1 hypothetical protein NNW99_38795 [Streptomyces sp. CRCS-T-1]
MNADRRMTSEELLQELRAALDADTGWVPALCAPSGPAGLPADAGLSMVVGRLLEFASAPGVPAPVALTLQRSAEAADMALVTEGAAQYGHLGAAYAYLTQARGLVDRDDR